MNVYNLAAPALLLGTCRQLLFESVCARACVAYTLCISQEKASHFHAQNAVPAQEQLQKDLRFLRYVFFNASTAQGTHAHLCFRLNG